MRGDDAKTTRRSLLAGTGAVAVGGLASVAGCTAGLPPLGQRVNFGRVDAPETPAPEYRAWLPAPSELPGGAAGDATYPVERVSPGDLGGETAGRTFTIPQSLVVSQSDYFGVGYENYDRVVSSATATVFEGEFQGSTVVDTLSQGGYEGAGSLEAFDLYRRRDGKRTVAVTDGTLLFAHHGPEDGGVDQIRTHLRAKRGELPRYHEADEGFDALSRATGGRPWAWIRRGVNDRDPVSETVTDSASGMTATDEAVYFFNSYLYPEPGAVDRQQLRSTLERSDRALGSEATDLRVEGRVATAEIHLTHDAYGALFDAGDAVDYPQVTWTTEAVEGAVQFRHEAGDPVAGERLQVKYLADGWRLPDSPVVTDAELGPGDALTVDRTALEGADRVSLWYRHPSDARGIVAQHDLEG